MAVRLGHVVWSWLPTWDTGHGVFVDWEYIAVFTKTMLPFVHDEDRACDCDVRIME